MSIQDWKSKPQPETWSQDKDILVHNSSTMAIIHSFFSQGLSSKSRVQKHFTELTKYDNLPWNKTYFASPALSFPVSSREQFMEHRLPYHDLCYIGLKAAEPYDSVLAIPCKFRPKPIFQDCCLHFMPFGGMGNHHKSPALPEAVGILIKISKKRSNHQAGMKRHSPGAAAGYWEQNK